MRKIVFISALAFSCAIGWSADWLTDGGDSQRTHWQKDEKLISPATAKNIKLLWKLQLDSKPRVMTNLYTALITNRVTTKSGPKQIALVAGVTDKLFAIDVDAGTVLWKKQFSSTSGDYSPLENGSILCPGGQTATPYIAATTPGKYSDLRRIRRRFAAPDEPRGWRRPRAAGEIRSSRRQDLGAQRRQRRHLHAYFAGLRRQSQCRLRIRPGHEQGGQLGPAGGGMWGRTGPAVSPTTGAMYTGTGDGQWHPETGVYGNGIVGLKQDPDTKELKLYDYFGPRNAAWLVKRDLDAQVTPVIFNYKGRGTLAYSVAANVGGASNYRTATLKVAGQTIPILRFAGPVSQAITIETLSSLVDGAPPFTISAAASSGLPVSFTSTTPTVYSVGNHRNNRRGGDLLDHGQSSRQCELRCGDSRG